MKLNYVLVRFILLFVVITSISVGCTKQRHQESASQNGSLAVMSASKELAPAPEQLSAGKDPIMDLTFSESGHGVAYSTTSNGVSRVYLNGAPGKPYQEILYVRISRDGSRIAHAARTETKWRMVVDGREGMYFDEMGSPVFSPDGKHVMYDAKIGDQWHIVIDENMSNFSSFSFYDKLFTNDGTKIITLENSAPDNTLAHVVVRDLKFKQLSRLDVTANRVKFNTDKTRFVGLGERDGKKWVIVVNIGVPAIVHEGRKYDDIDRLVFSSDGTSLSYVAVGEGKKYLVLNDKEQVVTAGEPTLQSPVIRPGHLSASIVMKSGQDNFIFSAFGENGINKSRYEEIAFITYDATGSSYAYCARNGTSMFYVINGNESPVYDKVLAPVFSPDGTRVVARVRKDGKRFVIVMDSAGKVLSQHASYDIVNTTTFTSDGKSVAYGVLDGKKLVWKVEKL